MEKIQLFSLELLPWWLPKEFTLPFFLSWSNICCCCCRWGNIYLIKIWAIFQGKWKNFPWKNPKEKNEKKSGPTNAETAPSYFYIFLIFNEIFNVTRFVMVVFWISSNEKPFIANWMTKKLQKENVNKVRINQFFFWK